MNPSYPHCALHDVCVAQGEFQGRVQMGPEMRRPSGLQLDRERRELYVLTLFGNFALTKYKLQW